MSISSNFLFVKIKITIPLLCVCVHSAWKGRPRNDLHCVGWDVKPYSLIHWTTVCCRWCWPRRRLVWRWIYRWLPVRVGHANYTNPVLAHSGRGPVRDDSTWRHTGPGPASSSPVHGVHQARQSIGRLCQLFPWVAASQSRSRLTIVSSVLLSNG